MLGLVALVVVVLSYHNYRHVNISVRTSNFFVLIVARPYSIIHDRYYYHYYYYYYYYYYYRVINSLGLSVKDFNIIMRRLQHDPELRKRVLDQAQLYRIEARINDRLLSTIPYDEERPGNTKVASLLDDEFNTPLSSNFQRPPQRIELFAKSLKEIEALRIDHAQQVHMDLWSITTITTASIVRWLHIVG